MQFPCIDCAKEVRPRQHAVLCESCERWQHRTCKTGISIGSYKEAVKNGNGLSFICHQCLSFYRLVPALRNKAELLSYELRLVRDGVTARRIRPVYQMIEKKVKELWERYLNNEINTSELLKDCVKTYGPQCEAAHEVEEEVLVTRL